MQDLSPLGDRKPRATRCEPLMTYGHKTLSLGQDSDQYRFSTVRYALLQLGVTSFGQSRQIRLGHLAGHRLIEGIEYCSPSVRDVKGEEERP